MGKTIFLALLLVLFLGGGARAEQPGYSEPGLDEKPGSFIPLDLTFRDEAGEPVIFGKLIDRPAVIMLVYYSCSHICPQLLGGVAKSLGDLSLDPRNDYRVLTVSFDESDRPADAYNARKNYIKAIGRPFPDNAWCFLTGDRKNIRRLVDAVGARFKSTEHGFVHPEVLIFVSPQGKITRYMQVPRYSYGVADPMIFSAVDLKTAFTDASLGKVFVSRAGAAPLFCFLHEPANQERFFNMLKASGVLTVLGLFLLFVYLRSGKKVSR